MTNLSEVPSQLTMGAAIATLSDVRRQPPPALAIPDHTVSTNDTDGGKSFPGGKGQLYQKLINLIPPHETFITAFAGNCTILRHKRPAAKNIAIDRNDETLTELRSNIVKDGDNAIVDDRYSHYRFYTMSALEWLDTYTFTGDEFIYADPPYLFSTRRQQRQLYRYEMGTEAEHTELLTLLKTLPCKIMVSGYMSPLYAASLKDWHSKSYQVRTRGNSWATEYVWMNYTEPPTLHDYKHLGNNYRERERIKRKVKRWKAKYENLDNLERQAILSSLLEVTE